MSSNARPKTLALIALIALLLATPVAGGRSIADWQPPREPTYTGPKYVLLLPNLQVSDIDVCRVFGRLYVDVDVVNHGTRTITGPVKLRVDVDILGEAYTLTRTVQLDLAPNERERDVAVGDIELPFIQPVDVTATVDPATPARWLGDWLESNELDNTLTETFVPDPTSGCGYSEL